MAKFGLHVFDRCDWSVFLPFSPGCALSLHCPRDENSGLFTGRGFIIDIRRISES